MASRCGPIVLSVYPCLMPQSNRARVEVWSSRVELSYGVLRVDVSIQLGESSFTPRTVILYFFCYINRNSHYVVRFVQKKRSKSLKGADACSLRRREGVSDPRSQDCLHGIDIFRIRDRHVPYPISFVMYGTS